MCVVSRCLSRPRFHWAHIITEQSCSCSRLTKAVKMLRVFSMGSMVERVEDLFNTSHASKQIMKNTCIMCVLAHYVAIFWYYLGKEEKPDGWVYIYDIQNFSVS